ncbi:MAG: aminodeoxychorismate/anthranilate synthase component II [Immundisolibacteraceae bacterium]|nr:aminodeoxychorismate/anthranilate synthase component II [Immundisolibacteraceae bacterium]
MLLMIDNYDSFTYNLVQYLGELGEQVEVVRNDAATVAELQAMAPRQIMISPGPCAPAQAGLSMELIAAVAGKIPLLGVCLGHQCLGEVFGGKVVHAREVMHGKVSPIYHDGKGVFAGLPTPFTATRYHSLVVEEATLPDCFEISAWTQFDDGSRDEIMGLRHKTLAVEGVQFHPESIKSEYGHELLRNFLQQKTPSE